MPQQGVEGSVLRLRDGRSLGYAVYGDPAGKPFFFFHGFPGSRLQARLGDPVARRLGVRIVAVDRPGMGLSDFRPRRRIGHWPADVEQVADALGIDRFAVGGISGGGPYAAACALKIPARLISAAIVSGMAPLTAKGTADGMSRVHRLVLALSRSFPSSARLPMWWMAREARRDPARLLARLTKSAPRPDREVIARPEVEAMFRDDLAEAFRQGARGPALELSLYARPWGFRLADIPIEVHLWQGEADANVPPAMGRYQARVIPRCRARFYPGEGHLLAVDRMEEIQAAVFPEETSQSR